LVTNNQDKMIKIERNINAFNFITSIYQYSPQTYRFIISLWQR